jgi:hypothetical protein
MADSYLAAHPKAQPVPVMTWQEMERLKARGLVKFPEESPSPVDHPAKAPTPAGQKKMGKPRKGALANWKANEERRAARYAAKKAGEAIDDAETEEDFLAREKGDNP